MNWFLSTAPQSSSLAGNCKVISHLGTHSGNSAYNANYAVAIIRMIPKPASSSPINLSHKPALQQQPLTLSHFYLCRAGHYGNSNQLAEQEADLTQAVALAKRSEDKLTLAMALSARADMHSFRGEYADSLVALFEAHQLYKALSHRYGIGYTVENIAISFRRMGEYDKAIEYLELSENRVCRAR